MSKNTPLLPRFAVLAVSGCQLVAGLTDRQSAIADDGEAGQVGETGGGSNGGESGNSTGGNSTGGRSTGGNSTGGNSIGGDSTGGRSGTSATGGSSGGDAGGSGGSNSMGGSSKGGSAGRGGASAGTGGAFTKTGVCEQYGEATVTADSFVGYEEFHIVSEECVDACLDNPTTADLVCLIRFEVTRSGAAPAGCVDTDDVPCEWSHDVTYGTQQKVIDVDDACSRSDVGWNQAWLDATDGSRVSYGFVDTWEGHASVVLKYSDTTTMWSPLALASWDDATGAFSFMNRLGTCRY